MLFCHFHIDFRLVHTRSPLPLPLEQNILLNHRDCVIMTDEPYSSQENAESLSNLTSLMYLYCKTTNQVTYLNIIRTKPTALNNNTPYRQKCIAQLRNVFFVFCFFVLFFWIARLMTMTAFYLVYDKRTANEEDGETPVITCFHMQWVVGWWLDRQSRRDKEYSPRLPPVRKCQVHRHNEIQDWVREKKTKQDKKLIVLGDQTDGR